MRWGILVLVAACGRIGFGQQSGPIRDGAGSAIDITIVGLGAIVGPSGFACADHCTLATTQPVTLQAVAGQAWQLDAFGPPCSAGDSCTLEPGTTVTVTFVRAPITANRVFVTSMPVRSDSGLTGFDTACANRATAAGVTGTFIAFASTSTLNARDRLAGHRGWVRMDGLPFIDQISDLGAVTLPRGLVFNETGAVYAPGTPTATGSDATGAFLSGQNCSDWTNANISATVEGLAPNEGSYYATGHSSSGCGNVGVVCFEVDTASAVTLMPPPFPAGRYVFLSSAAFGMNGIAGADAQCQQEATAAALPGTYRAILATTTESAFDHVGGFAGVWRRVDGLVVAEAGLDGVLDSHVAVDETGTTRLVVDAYFGAPSPTALGTTLSTCRDWTDPTTTGQQNMIAPTFMNHLLPTGSGGPLCNQAQHLLCAQVVP